MDDPLIDARIKGVPHAAGALRLSEIGRRGLAAAVGDMVGLGVSHPCSTFDRWRLMHVVDDDYRVVSAVQTCF